MSQSITRDRRPSSSHRRGRISSLSSIDRLNASLDNSDLSVSEKNVGVGLNISNHLRDDILKGVQSIAEDSSSSFFIGDIENQLMEVDAVDTTSLSTSSTNKPWQLYLDYDNTGDTGSVSPETLPKTSSIGSSSSMGSERKSLFRSSLKRAVSTSSLAPLSTPREGDIENQVIVDVTPSTPSRALPGKAKSLHRLSDDADDDTGSISSTTLSLSRTSSRNSLRSSLQRSVSNSSLALGLRKRLGSTRNLHGSNNSLLTLGDAQEEDSHQQSSALRRSTSFISPNFDFLVKKDDDYSSNKAKVSIQAGQRWWHAVFVISSILSIACVIILWSSYPIGLRQPSDVIAHTPWSDGCLGLQTCICPRETICADDLLSMIFLTLSRASAWFNYPLYMLLFLSKTRNLNNFLQRTMLRCWINFSDMHKVHSLFGMVVGLESTSHSFFHILRWARRKDDIQLLWTHQTGITGFVALLVGMLVMLPMAVPGLKKNMSFEWRKGLHYLSIVWGACLMYHAPNRIFWMIGIPLAMYAADHVFGIMLKTHLVENAHFERLGEESCVITFENPSGFERGNSSYVYIMLPWLSKYQFHAFSVYPSRNPKSSQMCISKSGKWTTALMDELTTPVHRPAFIMGPYLSPFNSPAMDCQNIIAVASGIGITPVISLIMKYTSTQRCINLIWICRDPGILEHFINSALIDIGNNGIYLIYYTGKRPLVIEKDLPPNVLIYQGRPDLKRTIDGVVSSVSSGDKLFDDEDREQIIKSNQPELRAKLLLEKALSIYSIDQLFNYAMEVSGVSNGKNQELKFDTSDNFIDYNGVVALMQQLLKDSFRAIKKKVSQTFEEFDSVSPHLLNLAEFGEFMHCLLEQKDAKNDGMDASMNSMKCDIMFQSKQDGQGVLDTSSRLAEEYKLKMYLQEHGKDWSMLYCGGSSAVLGELKKYKHKFGIGLAVEKFDW